MTRGSVQNLHALLPVTFLLGAARLTIEFVVDTGFTGALALSEAAIASLQLPYLYDVPADLADDTTRDLPVHSAVIEWDDRALTVDALGTGRRPLLGTALLSGKELCVQFAEGGEVRLEDL